MASQRLAEAGYMNVFDLQGAGQWTLGMRYDNEGFRFNQTTQETFLTATEDLANTVTMLPGLSYIADRFDGVQLDPEAGLLRWVNNRWAAYKIFAFEDADESDPENAVAVGELPAHNSTNTVRVFDLSTLDLSEDGDYYFRIQALPNVMVPVRGYIVDGEQVYWGAPSALSAPAAVTPPADPFAGAAVWAAPYLPEALEAGLLSERMFGAWTAVPTRVEAAEDIVRFAKVFLGAEDLAELYEMLELDEVEPWADTNDANARFLRAAGVSTGLDNVNFGPDLNFTRAHMIVMLYRLADAMGLDMEGYPLGSEFFDDVPNWPQAEEAIGWAYEVGITAGTGGRTFSPNSPLQNQHIAVFAIRALRALAEG